MEIPEQRDPIHRVSAGERVLQYRILRPLGKGGMGEVFLAEDTILQRKVALKFLSSDLAPDATARKLLLREARAAAGLDHPYICRIYEIGEAEGQQFIAMEYVEGTTIGKMLASGPLPLDQALRLVVEIAEALESAHRQGTVHRDLKPANIMVSSSGHVKVMDFGLAKRVIPDQLDQPDRVETATLLTQPGTITGTLAYMSPEQLRNDPVDARSDLFALGIIFYEILTATHPFQKESALGTASAILKDTPPPIEQYRGDIPRHLEDVLRRVLEKDRDQRYSSAREVLDEVAAVRSETQTGAIAPLDHLRALARRPALVLILGLLAAAGSWWGYRTLYSPQTVLAFRARDWILIADFENLTGDDVFNGSLYTALTVGIEQSKYVNVLPRSRVNETLRRMGRERPPIIDETLAREIAIREGIKGLLACSIARVGDTYSLTTRLLDPNSQLTALTEVSRAANKNEVLRALDDLAKRVRKKLGESLSGMAGPNLPLPKATTASLEALKLFAASRFPKPGQKAEALLEEAVKLDPDFALAHADLGVDYYIDGERPLGEEHFQKALQLLDRLTLKEQLWIRAVVEDWRGNRDGAIGQYESFVAQYPDSSAGWYRLGWARMITDRSEPAIQAFRKVLEIDPKSWGAYINIASAHTGVGKYTEAVANYEKAFALEPDSLYGEYVNHEYGFTLIEMGEVARAEEAFHKMLLRDEPSKARALRSLALLRMYQGKYGEAIPHLKEAILINQALKATLSEFRNRMYLARAYRANGNVAAFEAELHAAGHIHATTAISPEFSFDLGKMYVRDGKLKEAGLVLQKAERALSDTSAMSSVNLDTRRNRALVETLKGEEELAGSRPARATEILEVAYRLLPEPMIMESLAYAYWKLGNWEEAARDYQKLVEHPHLGDERQEDWIQAHYQLGRGFQQAGDDEKARQYYEKLLAIWKDGDRDLTAAVDARRQLTRLRR